MVTPTSRRAFLMGRRIAATPFEQFCARLERTCLGSVRTAPANAHSAETAQAWLKPVRQEDVAHARALCQEYRVALRLEGREQPAVRTQATLWVSPQPAGATLSLVDSSTGVWRADAGCTVAQLQETGIFDGLKLAPDLTLAQWFAWPADGPAAASLNALRLIERAEVLLADGTVEVLGPFGATAQAPLRSLTVQRMVPKLFELASSDSAQRCAQVVPWPAGYRLDALMANAAHEPNLAQLLFAHRGNLGWVQALWLKRPSSVLDPKGLPLDTVRAPEREQVSTPPFETGTSGQTGCQPATISQLASHLDQELKHILDPLGVFGSNSILKGLESAS